MRSENELKTARQGEGEREKQSDERLFIGLYQVIGDSRSTQLESQGMKYHS